MVNTNVGTSLPSSSNPTALSSRVLRQKLAETRATAFSIVVTDGQNAQVAVLNHVYQTVCGIDAAAPRTLQFPFERLWLTETREWRTHRITYQRVDPLAFSKAATNEVILRLFN